jgi:hypothetical protein
MFVFESTVVIQLVFDEVIPFLHLIDIIQDEIMCCINIIKFLGLKTDSLFEHLKNLLPAIWISGLIFTFRH